MSQYDPEDFLRILIGVPQEFKIGEITSVMHEVVCFAGTNTEIVTEPEDEIIVVDEKGRDVTKYAWWAKPGKYVIKVTSFAICPSLGAEKAPTSIAYLKSPEPPEDILTYDYDLLVGALAVGKPTQIKAKDQTFTNRSEPHNVGVVSLRLTSLNAPSNIETDPELFARHAPTGIDFKMMPVIQDAPTGITSAKQLEQENSPTDIQQYEGLTNLHSPTSLIAYTASSVQPHNANVLNLDFSRYPNAIPTTAGVIDLELKVGPTSIAAMPSLNSNSAPGAISAVASPLSSSSVTGLGTLVDMDEDGYYADVDMDDNDPSIGSVLLEDPLWRRWDNDFPDGPIYGDHNNITDEWTVHVCNGCSGFTSTGRNWFNIDDYVTNPLAISHYTIVGNNGYGTATIDYSGVSAAYAHAYINGRYLSKASGQAIVGFTTLTGLEITAHGHNGTSVTKVFNLGAGVPLAPQPVFTAPAPLPYDQGITLRAEPIAHDSSIYRMYNSSGNFYNDQLLLDGSHIKTSSIWTIDGITEQSASVSATDNLPPYIMTSGTGYYKYSFNPGGYASEEYLIPNAITILGEDRILPLGVPNYTGNSVIKTTTGTTLTDNTHANDYIDYVQPLGVEFYNESEQTVTQLTTIFRVSDVQIEDVTTYFQLIWNGSGFTEDHRVRPMITSMKITSLGMGSSLTFGDEHSPTSIQALASPASSAAPINLDYFVEPQYTQTEFFNLFPQAVALGMAGRSAELPSRGEFNSYIFDWYNFSGHNGIQSNSTMPHKWWLYNGNPSSNNPTGILEITGNRTWVGYTVDYNAADGTYTRTSQETNIGYITQPYFNDANGNPPAPPATSGGFIDWAPWQPDGTWTPTHYFGDVGKPGYPNFAWLDGFGSFDWGYQPPPDTFSP